MKWRKVAIKQRKKLRKNERKLISSEKKNDLIEICEERERETKKISGEE